IGPVSPGIAHKILQMMRGELNEPKPLINIPADDFDFSLTIREKQILQLLIEGLYYKEIGEQLGISVHTAKKHVLNIYQKLHVSSRAQALKLAVKKGLI